VLSFCSGVGVGKRKGSRTGGALSRIVGIGTGWIEWT